MALACVFNHELDFLVCPRRTLGLCRCHGSEEKFPVDGMGCGEKQGHRECPSGRHVDTEEAVGEGACMPAPTGTRQDRRGSTK